jgi:transcriptional regulator with XRE-family HTH domain
MAKVQRRAGRGPVAGGLGRFIRSQRQLSALSLRQLAELSSVSNAYLSQIERGLHQPSLRVVRAIAQALDIKPETMLSHAGFADESGVENPLARSEGTDVEGAIEADDHLGGADKQMLLGMYRRLRNAHD